MGLMIFGYEPDLNSVPTVVYLYGIATSILLMMIFTRIYFQKSGIKPNTSNGAKFGFIAILVGFIVDVCFVILPMLLSQTGPNLTTYYSQPLFWANIAAIPVTSAITGSYLEKNRLGTSSKTTGKTLKSKKKSSKKS